MSAASQEAAARNHTAMRNLFAERKALNLHDPLDYLVHVGVLHSLMRAFGPGITLQVIAGMTREDIMAVSGIGSRRVRQVELALHHISRGLRTATPEATSRLDTIYDWEIPRDDRPAHVSLRGLTATIADAGIDLDRCQVAYALDTQPDDPPEVPPWHEWPHTQQKRPTSTQVARARRLLDRAGYDVVRRAS